MPEQNKELAARFRTIPPLQPTAHLMDSVRELFAVIAKQVDALVPDGREKSLALTKLEEAKFWANQGLIIVDNKQQREEL